MGFERLFLHKDEPHEKESEADEVPDPKRRAVLKGLGVLAAVAVLPKVDNAEAADLPENLQPENLESNVDKIRAYQVGIEQNRAALDVAPDLTKPLKDLRREVYPVIKPQCDLRREALVGTEFDHEAWFREGCTERSWPSIQLRYVKGQEMPSLRFGHYDNVENEQIVRRGNGFILEDHFFSNNHMIEGRLKTQKISDDLDIAAVNLRDYEWSDQARDSIDRVRLHFDRRKINEDLHGQLVHVPSIHEKRGTGSDNTEVVSGVAIRLTENLVKRLGLPATITVRNYKNNGEGTFELPLMERYLNSYVCVIPSNDTNGKIDDEDGTGLSGSPLLTDVDSALGRNIASGIVWGVGKAGSLKLIYFHGPEVVGEMLDRANTIVSSDTDKEANPWKIGLTARIQERLSDLGFYTMEVDGGYGDGTKAAVEAYQKDAFGEDMFAASIIPGVVDFKTWGALFPEERNLTKGQIHALA
jgi:hypothetical protein